MEKINNTWINLKTLFKISILELNKTTTITGSLYYTEDINFVKVMNIKYAKTYCWSHRNVRHAESIEKNKGRDKNKNQPGEIKCEGAI